MLIGVPKEIKVHEYRVGMTPASVREAVHHGHTVLVEKGVASKIGIEDSEYLAAGARVADSADLIWSTSDLIVKVKEPQPEEYQYLRKGQILFTYLHLAPDRPQAEALIASGCTAIAYETVTDGRGGLPLLAPMSVVAGRMAVQAGAHYLEIAHGGRGQLLGGVPGVASGKVVIFGGGTVGTNAARMAMGLGASVWVVDHNPQRLDELDERFGPMLNTIFPTIDAVEQHVLDADLVIGAVLVPGSTAPHVITESIVRDMRRGTVLVDVSIDQGGCFETSHPTTHANPVYMLHDVVHYCVTNMPGAVARTSTFALNNVTLPFVLQIADKGWSRAMKDDSCLASGLNVHDGKVINDAVAQALGFESTRIE